ncbi:MAG: nucleotide exchange factor GrpE [Candidatus Gastranaerophilales bacterium]|nr:nucleotide exchange factor GrpE [Candidatus Gastranaerophilales bacterium]
MSEKENPFEKELEQETSEKTTKSVNEENQNEILEININKEFEELKNQYIRLAADFDNYRKRQAQERESLLKYGAEDTLKKLLPVIDTFERAQKSILETDDCEQLKESFEIVKKQFFEALEKAGLQKIETNGAEFNPNIHEAVMQTPSSEHPEHSIITELQSGYKLGDRIIRPALVNVAVSE